MMGSYYEQHKTWAEISREMGVGEAQLTRRHAHVCSVLRERTGIQVCNDILLRSEHFAPETTPVVDLANDDVAVEVVQLFGRREWWWDRPDAVKMLDEIIAHQLPETAGHKGIHLGQGKVLSESQLRAVRSFAAGQTVAEMAENRGIGEDAVYSSLMTGEANLLVFLSRNIELLADVHALSPEEQEHRRDVQTRFTRQPFMELAKVIARKHASEGKPGIHQRIYSMLASCRHASRGGDVRRTLDDDAVFQVGNLLMRGASLERVFLSVSALEDSNELFHFAVAKFLESAILALDYWERDSWLSHMHEEKNRNVQELLEEGFSRVQSIRNHMMSDPDMITLAYAFESIPSVLGQISNPALYTLLEQLGGKDDFATVLENFGVERFSEKYEKTRAVLTSIIRGQEPQRKKQGKYVVSYSPLAGVLADISARSIFEGDQGCFLEAVPGSHSVSGFFVSHRISEYEGTSRECGYAEALVLALRQIITEISTNQKNSHLSKFQRQKAWECYHALIAAAQDWPSNSEEYGAREGDRLQRILSSSPPDVAQWMRSVLQQASGVTKGKAERTQFLDVSHADADAITLRLGELTRNLARPDCLVFDQVLGTWQIDPQILLQQHEALINAELQQCVEAFALRNRHRRTTQAQDS